MRELQSQNVQEPGVEAADYSDLQVLLTSSQDFGPASIRELTVRFTTQNPPTEDCTIPSALGWSAGFKAMQSR